MLKIERRNRNPHGVSTYARWHICHLVAEASESYFQPTEEKQNGNSKAIFYRR